MLIDLHDKLLKLSYFYFNFTKREHHIFIQMYKKMLDYLGLSKADFLLIYFSAWQKQ